MMIKRDIEGQTDKQWNEEVKIPTEGQTYSGTERQTGVWKCETRGRDKETAVGVRGLLNTYCVLITKIMCFFFLEWRMKAEGERWVGMKPDSWC